MPEHLWKEGQWWNKPGLIWQPPDPYQGWLDVTLKCGDCGEWEKTKVMPGFKGKPEDLTYMCNACVAAEADYDDEPDYEPDEDF